MPQEIERRAPQNADHEIDGTGMYLMPGFVNLHAHLGDNNKAREAEYVYKLYLAHGVNPGQNRIRMALVAEVEECLEAAHRIVEFTGKLARR